MIRGVWVVVDRYGTPVRGLAGQIVACKDRGDAQGDADRYNEYGTGTYPPHEVRAAELRIIEDGPSHERPQPTTS